MPGWVQAATTAEVPPGSMKGVMVNGREILLANVEGTLYATQNRCPHLGWRLSGGTLEGRVVTCPGHDSQFDMATGQVVRWATRMPRLLSGVNRVLRPSRPLNTYQVKVEDDSILVHI
jgi:nitrite reductase/ring-hydroxylating ferredoxin subunit